MRERKRRDWIILYIAVLLGIAFLRFSLQYSQRTMYFFDGFVTLIEHLIQYFGLTELAIALQKLPLKLVLLCVEGIQMVVGFLLLLCFQNTMKQGTALLLEKSVSVIKAGGLLYSMFFLTIVAFFYSVIGLPIGGAILLLLCIAVGFGKIPLCIFLGYLLAEALHIKGELYLEYLLGSFVVVLFESVFMIGSEFLFFLFPVIALGVDFWLLLYRFVYQCSLPVTFLEDGEPWNRKKMRDRILKDM